MSERPDLTCEDWLWLEAQGFLKEEVERQLQALLGGYRPVRISRAARVGDGIETVDLTRAQELVERAREAKARGAFSKFVPASGAATRMFGGLNAWLDRPVSCSLQELERERRQGVAEAEWVAAALQKLPETALGVALCEKTGIDVRRGIGGLEEAEFARLLETLRLWSKEPKALLPFHARENGVRTAFEEHIWEGLGYLEDREGRSRFHFTVPEGTLERFGEVAAKIQGELPAGLRVDVSFSVQERSTGTLALDLETGQLVRDEDGRPLLRPGGHGALLGNLARVGSPIVFIKNIDNVLPEAWHSEVTFWQLVLAGRLDELLEELGPERVAPARVVGVVPNRGEPGGGPFWVFSTPGKSTLQVVERVEVEESDAQQATVFQSATHFNPVQMVAAIRDGWDRPIALGAWADPDRMMVSVKRERGRHLRVLEHPGLWNGGMAHWETRFVEVPGHLFAPVKTVFDLARPEHRA